MINQKNIHTNNNQLKGIINEKISLITATKWIEYLRMNLYKENYKRY